MTNMMTPTLATFLSEVILSLVEFEGGGAENFGGGAENFLSLNPLRLGDHWACG